MKERIKKSCDQILPTEQQKKKMFEIIVNKKKKRGFQKRWIIGSFATVAVIFIFISLQPKEAVPKFSIARMRIETIEYKGKCYEYVGFHNGKNLKRTNDQIMGGIIYQIKGQNSAIVIVKNGEYQHYQKCRGE